MKCWRERVGLGPCLGFQMPLVSHLPLSVSAPWQGNTHPGVAHGLKQTLAEGIGRHRECSGAVRAQEPPARVGQLPHAEWPLTSHASCAANDF